MLPQEILILDLLLDAIWWNLGQFSHEHNLPFNTLDKDPHDLLEGVASV